MVAIPKPSKDTRTREKRKVKNDLIEYRRTQAAIAIERDNDQCVICWFRDGVYKKREHIHHIYGRGRVAGDWRERASSLMCVCAACHPLPIHTPGGSRTLGWVEDIAQSMLGTPINKYFTRTDQDD